MDAFETEHERYKDTGKAIIPERKCSTCLYEPDWTGTLSTGASVGVCDSVGTLLKGKDGKVSRPVVVGSPKELKTCREWYPAQEG